MQKVSRMNPKKHESTERKPRRGGLFLATNTHRLFFLFFGGAAFATPIRAMMSAPITLCAREFSPRRAAEKRKEGERFASSSINRPPLRGLGCKHIGSSPCNPFNSFNLFNFGCGFFALDLSVVSSHSALRTPHSALL